MSYRGKKAKRNPTEVCINKFCNINEFQSFVLYHSKMKNV